jgi:uncharacterized protein YprB with RNaseH-like and TPR domain
VTRTNDFKKYVVFDIETEGLHPWHGDRITCICAKDSDGNRFKMAQANERDMIQQFIIWMKRREPTDYILITQNGNHFDIPFLCTRMVILGFGESIYLYLTYYPHFDIAKITDRHISLNDLAKLFGCKQKTASGKDAIRFWKEKRFEALTKYCMNDVEVTEQVYLKHMMLVRDKV